ncbi:hypothetical protein, partial [Aquabacterium sp.]|uniref:hypothetical protein n=1 Tax=Aquabacterium sp. TaxID=1872578 RepID=UPI0025B9CF54
SFTSQEQAKAIFESSGGHYVLHVLEGADHAVEHLNEASQRADQLTMAERLARDLGLVLKSE